MKATLEVSKPRNSAHEKLRRWLKVSICVLALVSVAVVFYSAFSSTAAYHWQCPACDTRPTATAAAVANATAASPTNISHIMFGIGGSAATWLQRQAYIELWWRPDVMRGHVWLESEPLEPWPGSCPPYRISAANTSRYGSRADAARIARIVADAYLVAPPGVRWFVMGNDDTVFFTENLVAVLGRYDHEEMWYIGASSESVEQNVMHSYGMAFGGGGFAVSFPAAGGLRLAFRRRRRSPERSTVVSIGTRHFTGATSESRLALLRSESRSPVKWAFISGLTFMILSIVPFNF